MDAKINIVLDGIIEDNYGEGDAGATLQRLFESRALTAEDVRSLMDAAFRAGAESGYPEDGNE